MGERGRGSNKEGPAAITLTNFDTKLRLKRCSDPTARDRERRRERER